LDLLTFQVCETLAESPNKGQARRMERTL